MIQFSALTLIMAMIMAFAPGRLEACSALVVTLQHSNLINFGVPIRAQAGHP
jgi:hypothetical protein